jgi:hypothetical protein
MDPAGFVLNWPPGSGSVINWPPGSGSVIKWPPGSVIQDYGTSDPGIRIRNKYSRIHNNNLKVFTIFTYQERILPLLKKTDTTVPVYIAGITRLPDIFSEALKNKKIVLLEGAPQRYSRFSSSYSANTWPLFWARWYYFYR